MARPRKKRNIEWRCNFTHIAPTGPGIFHLEEVSLSHEELEALRLKDYHCMGQKQAAEQMSISQPTFHRIIQGARKKIADALVNNKMIRIQSTNEMAKTLKR